MEVGSERLEELRIVEQIVDGLELGGHSQTHLNNEYFPQGGLRVQLFSRRGHDPY